MVRAPIIGPTRDSTSVSGRTIRCTGPVFSPGATAESIFFIYLLIKDITGSTSTIKKRDKVFLNGPMERNTKLLNVF